MKTNKITNVYNDFNLIYLGEFITKLEVVSLLVFTVENKIYGMY